MTKLSRVIVCSAISVKSGVKSYVGEMGKSMKALEPVCYGLDFFANFARKPFRSHRMLVSLVVSGRDGPVSEYGGVLRFPNDRVRV
jgi:hypothetical protein